MQQDEDILTIIALNFGSKSGDWPASGSGRFKAGKGRLSTLISHIQLCSISKQRKVQNRFTQLFLF
jgi:hypothetical protein